MKDDEIPVNQDQQYYEKMVFQPPIPLLGENILPGRESKFIPRTLYVISLAVIGIFF
jgi:hypothetical protein